MYGEFYDKILSGEYLQPVGEEIKPEWPVLAYVTASGEDSYFIIKTIDGATHDYSLYLIGIDFLRINRGKFDYDANDYLGIEYNQCQGLHYLGKFIRTAGKSPEEFLSEIKPLVESFKAFIAIENLG